MFTPEGYFNITPKIKSLSFPKRGYFEVDLEDGRIIIVPVSAFPNLKKCSCKSSRKLLRHRWGFVPRGDSYRANPRQLSKFPSCLVLGKGNEGIAIHTVVSHDGTVMYVITGYYPDPNIWYGNFKVKK